MGVGGCDFGFAVDIKVDDFLEGTDAPGAVDEECGE